MNQLHPGAKWQFRIGAYFGLIFLMFFLSFFIAPFFIALLGISGGNASSIIIAGGIFFIVYIAGIIILGEIYATMTYNRWFYEFTSTNLKIERGIIWKRYSNVPYDRIQNVDIHRGIIARLFGFSSVMIQTAGYSGARGGMGVEGYIPAVSIEEAEKIRDFVIKKISHRKGGI